MSLWQATLETRNFSFEAFGTTESEALEMLELGLVRHAAEYRVAIDWWREYQADIVARHLSPRTVYRGPQLLLGRA